MRKITENMLAAIVDGREWKEKATSTHKGERGILVRLHDNLIAIITPDTVEITAAGWVTSTTCDRLNAITRHFAGASVGRKQGDLVIRQDGKTETYGARDRIALARLN